MRLIKIHEVENIFTAEELIFLSILSIEYFWCEMHYTGRFCLLFSLNKVFNRFACSLDFPSLTQSKVIKYLVFVGNRNETKHASSLARRI